MLSLFLSPRHRAMITFKCPTCSTEMKVKSDYAGKAGRCKKCGEVLQVPSKETPRTTSAASSGGVIVVKEVEALPKVITNASPTEGISWYIKVSNEVYGPYALNVMKEFAEIERLQPHSVIGESPGGPFYHASKIKAFFANEPQVEERKIDTYGVWCPHCGNRCSQKHTSPLGCFITLILGLFTLGIGLIVFIFLPHEWHCNQCQHRWRA